MEPTKTIVTILDSEKWVKHGFTCDVCGAYIEEMRSVDDLVRLDDGTYELTNFDICGECFHSEIEQGEGL